MKNNKTEKEIRSEKKEKLKRISKKIYKENQNVKKLNNQKSKKMQII